MEGDFFNPGKGKKAGYYTGGRSRFIGSKKMTAGAGKELLFNKPPQKAPIEAFLIRKK